MKNGTPAVIAVCGVKNSGKTTLLVHVLPVLRERGLRVAVIKHDGHDFDPDVKGTDSYRLRTSGALGVAVYSRGRFMIVREEASPTVEDLTLYFQDMDLVLLEGGKNSNYPKLVVRPDLMSPPIVGPVLAFCGSFPAESRIEGVPHLDPTDYRGIVDVILGFYESARRPAVRGEEQERKEQERENKNE
ncbi:MAG: molybdopterin-guanine dinucleotide biosynthesis protein B [Synergistaceae bacterium]|jgi:molybdopterin-guanine dinucleotide biosynthesis protein MobB|nr:molybdopterin-guanine dinucleotide biosynthesis protein B [Synergistaceae bacterium]